jgi:hypothetical protein
VSLVLILHVFRVRRVYKGLIFFSLVLILRIPAYNVSQPFEPAEM